MPGESTGLMQGWRHGDGKEKGKMRSFGISWLVRNRPPGPKLYSCITLVVVIAVTLTQRSGLNWVDLLSIPIPMLPSTGKTDLAKTKMHILYQDWRGTSLESIDRWTFSHKWHGSLDLGEIEMKKVVAPELSFVGSEEYGDKKSLSELKEYLFKNFKVMLEGSWEQNQASVLLDQLQGLCSPTSKSDQSAFQICDIQHDTHWKLSDNLLSDDISLEGSDVFLARRALEFAAPRSAKVDGESGVVRSHRLQFALMKFVTNWGQKEKVVNQILRRKFGCQLDVDVGYIDLTSVTTYEDRERFQAFKAPELLFMMESWSLLPKHLVGTFPLDICH